MPGKKASTEYSCVVCTQRKVRCNKEKPCQNCSKAGIECQVTPPAPPRRRKRRLDEQQLVRRLARYEELMDNSGIDFRSANRELGSLTDIDNTSLSVLNEQAQGKIVERDEDGPRQYHREFESATNILFGNAAEAETARATFHNAFDTVFGGANNFPLAIGSSANVDLIDVHPSGTHILQLWQTYINNVDPLLRLTHTPILQKKVIEASGKLASRLTIDNGLEALLFNIYFISLNSMTDEESMANFGVAKSSLQAKYHVASQQALLNANLMRTLDLKALQAYLLHLTSIRMYIDPRTHYVMIGIAVRIAIRLGLHKDGAQLGVCPFETEERRRLWWNLVALDKRVAETTGAAVTAMSTPRADCKRPLNVNDSDLCIDAKQAPVVSDSSTEMVFCLARYEIAATAAPDGSNTIPTLPPGTRSDETYRRRPRDKDKRNGGHDKVKVSLEDYARYVEFAYLKGLDQSIPLHLFTTLTTRQNIRKLQLIANVSNILRQPSTSSPDIRQWAFEESLRLLDDDNTMQSTPSLRGWLWYTHMYFPFPAYMFLVHELKRHCAGDLCSRAWEAMDRNHHLRGLVGPGRKGTPMHFAYGKHFLEAWNARIQAESESGQILQTPAMIELIQQIHQPVQPLRSEPQSAFLPSTGPVPSDLQIWQGWYGSNDMGDSDPLSTFEDISGMEYVIPALL